MRTKLFYGAYGWLLFSGFLHFGIDVVSQYLRHKRPPGPEATLYYGLNTSYALGQAVFAGLALLLLRSGSPLLGQWQALALGFFAAAAWLAISNLFIEYPQPRIVAAIFAVLLAAAAFTH